MKMPLLFVRRLGTLSDATIAGIISTGTHGSGKDFPAIYAYVSKQRSACSFICITQISDFRYDFANFQRRWWRGLAVALWSRST